MGVSFEPSTPVELRGTERLRSSCTRKLKDPNLYCPLLVSGLGPCDWRSLTSGDLVTNQEKRKGDLYPHEGLDVQGLLEIKDTHTAPRKVLCSYV